MEKIKLTFLALGLLLFECNQKNDKSQSVTNDLSFESSDNSLSKIENSNLEELEGYENESIKAIIALFKKKDIERISEKISYPLSREYPIPPIKDKEEFIKRFNEVFDQILIDKIVNSTSDQWTEAGWRGTMFDNGVLWMANSDGIITTINYKSEFEENLVNKLIASEKENLHPSLKTFERPTYKIKTKKHLIRIDEVSDNKYRYASWKLSENESSKPDVILDQGELQIEGSGGNHMITFINGNYTYKVFRNIIGEENSPDITIEIEKDGQLILTEDGTLVI
jgi:hypothetical protein